MQKTKFRKVIVLVLRSINPIISDSWGNRSVLLLSLLFGFYFTNSLLSFLLDKSVNKIALGIIIIILMEISIRSYLISKFSRIIMSLNYLRIGSTYALILEAFKLGS